MVMFLLPPKYTGRFIIGLCDVWILDVREYVLYIISHGWWWCLYIVPRVWPPHRHTQYRIRCRSFIGHPGPIDSTGPTKQKTFRPGVTCGHIEYRDRSPPPLPCWSRWSHVHVGNCSHFRPTCWREIQREPNETTRSYLVSAVCSIKELWTVRSAPISLLL